MPPLTLCYTTKIFKSLLAISIALFGLLVGSGNILDYGTNWQFVQHVLSMDSMEPWLNGQALQGRAVTSVTVQQTAYTLIILGELVFGFVCFWGGVLMLHGSFVSRPERYIRGKALFTLGCIPALLVWYTGFAVIGGEYFAMWANQWNGQMKSYTFISFIILSLMYISQAESEQN
ncbi:DUF2165 domain-containing protein [Edwardsiella ictaluri]|uniref:DUF2165 domain-containing protein n=2 Tax=Edwardsiella ictaluri TaxID=67780 RepID=A0ABY8GHR2_EDWIC|nr:DUF2165 domain-containing protein [Edwardsiella ictaluri]ELV7529098.1 DUF2165 domain-containing protein [Edwardsiella ictaluri]KMQ77824.1 hypothetical protein ABY58_12295 [Edwardsiella ictaluri]KOO54672.1 hypothetical protein ACS33_12300 [Edwardsiella ictaluri]WFN96980.1 DUF2165 domain-containing protein [Edwardsiella ictaluri]